MQARWLAGLSAILTVLVVACGPKVDPKAEAARDEYFTALKGQDRGMPLDEQLEHINRAVQLDPQSPAYVQARAGLYASFGVLEQAESDLDQAIALGSQPYLHYLRGAVRCERRKFSAAVADFDLAIAALPGNAEFYIDRSIALTGARLPAKALNDAAHVISEQPSNADGFYARGVAFAAMGQSREAIADLSFVISEQPQLAYPLLVRARIYERLGDADRASDDRDAAGRDGHWGWAPCRHMDDPRPL